MKVLLLTTIYPLNNNNNQGTYVCHYFAKEWVKLGYDVKVVHIQAVYPHIFYVFAKLFRKQIASLTGAIVYDKRDKGDTFEKDGVQVHRYPLYKAKPHGKFNRQALEAMIQVIIANNKSNNYVPDIIAGHFMNPTIEVVSRLKENYNRALTSIVVHDAISQISSVYGNAFEQYELNIDIWGFRSKALKEAFEKEYGKREKFFMCYSGIPESLLCNRCCRPFQSPLSRFIFVGEFIKRKHPISIIKALSTVYEDKHFKMVYVGDGNELNEINAFVKENRLLENVLFTGKIRREDITSYLDNSECFIMISQSEAFGLVYLEAMARGCITIASRNEGVDGIIIDGVNGFLCQAGNSVELSQIIRRINYLSATERKIISDNAINTVKELTDTKVAINYVNSVLSSVNL